MRGQMGGNLYLEVRIGHGLVVIPVESELESCPGAEHTELPPGGVAG